ncbi:hypothetical protein [Paenibacillus ferrarius]|uniref:hypothetical protein n=1 Tax=Paenibacillus ferrarius TaxID=1469647 RepID=UPI001301BFA2|nr:hypothetical protein [Paenibacillus ferrarius]
MAIEKLKELNKIKEDLYALYPNAVKIQFTCEGDKVTLVPTEKYEISPEALVSEEEE